jgi:ankyrin repeat protein
LVDILLSDFHLDPSSVLDGHGNKAIHIAALKGHKQVIALLVRKYKCNIDSRNLIGQTPLHLAMLCFQSPTEDGRALIRMCISELKADVTIKDNNDNQPIHAAALAGHTRTVINLISDHHVSPNSRGFKKRNLLYHALAKGHTSTAKTLIEVFHLSLHCVDEDGNTPLHLSSLSEQPESVRFLLHKYHAPVYVRNKAGKNALDLATEDSTKKVIREYVRSEHRRIQQEYDKLRAKSLQKYSGQQIITRVFVLGNPGSGKSTLVESLKRKGLSYLLNVTEADVPLHTTGIVPSVHQSKEAGRLLYYDFAGDQEYFSSHAAILEMVSRSTIGSNIFLIVADLTKDDVILQDEVGYWLSFISYHGKALDSQCKLKVIVVLSHLDRLDVAEFDNKVDSARQCLQTHINQYNEVKFDVEIVSLNCRSPRSSKSIENILQQISKDTPPCSISYEASLLHGILEKDFRNVIACKFQKLLSSIEEIGIYLPSSADALHPIVRELHDIGLLMLIGRNEDELGDYLLLLNPSSLTNEVHEKLFSNSAVEKLESLIGPHFANMGILPESCLASILPDHITKECLVQLQYCQEFNHAEVGLDYSVTSNNASDCNLLYFPALCKLDKSDWSNDPKFIFSIGWYAECTEKFDYFPARFLHVLLLRLAYAFALPIVNRNSTKSSNEISAYSRRCTMWKNGIHWRMEEGVEYIVEIVNDNKGIIVITKYKWNSEKWAAVLGKIIDKAMQAKAEFCSAVSLHHYVLKSNSDDTSCYSDSENLFDIHDIDRVVRQRKNGVVSVGGHNSLHSSHVHILRRHSYWGRLQ